MATVADDASTALSRVQQDGHELDLILASLRLPGGDGVGFIRAIRGLDDGRIPIVVFSGSLVHARQVRDLADLAVAGYLNEGSTNTQLLSALAPHLFPNSFNRRGSSRVVTGLPVAFRHANTIAAAVTLNLGKGGVAIRTVSPLDPATRARVRFRLPNAKRDVDADARVTWCDRQLGMGLEFERIEPADQIAIDEFVERQREGA